MKSKLYDEDFENIEMDEVVVVDGTKTSSASKMGKIPIDVGKDVKVCICSLFVFTLFSKETLGSRFKIIEELRPN